MQRLTLGIISLIIMGAAFIYLWLINPLYAFIGGVVFLVFVIVGYALINTMSQQNTSPVEPAQHVLPRRTGEFRRVEDIERPEGSWEDLDTPPPAKPKPLDETLVFTDDDDEQKKEEAMPPASPPAPEPALAPKQAQSFGAISTEQDEVETEAPSEPASIYEEIEDIQEKNTQGANKTAEASEAEDEEWVEQITDEVTNSRLLAGVKDFDDFAENVQQQMDKGTLGDSPEDLEKFFQSAFDKANQRQDVEDYINDEEVDEFVEDLISGEGDDWLSEQAKAKRDRKLSTAEMMIEELNFEETLDDLDFDIKWEDSESEEDTTTEASDFDLMAMVNSLEPEKQQEFFAKMSEIPIGEQSEQQLIDLYQELSGNPTVTSDNNVSEAQFTAYYPRQASAGTEYGFYVYAHLPDALVAGDIQQFTSELGGRVPKPKVSAQTATIEEGSNIAVIIQCDKLKFNQLGAIQTWHEPYVRFDFNFIAHKALVDEIVEGRIAILLGMIEIASIDFQIGITPANPIAMVTAQPTNPLNAIGFKPSISASIYQKIFVSYSHDDTSIAEQYRKIQMMLGNTVFMDTHSIRVGEAWETALKKFIDEADVFQLFWSKNSATSEHVRFEWDYALNQRCPDTRCANFIRPTYWEKPLPDIPLELGHLHFAFIEME